MVNSWVELQESTPRAILHIYANLARGLTGCTRVTGVNSWVDLFYSTSNVMLSISSEFQRDFPGSKRSLLG